MNTLSSYLDKIRALLKDKTFEKKIIAQSLNELLTSNIDAASISVTTNGTVYVVGSASLKNAIFLKKKEIINACNKQGVKINDLR